MLLGGRREFTPLCLAVDLVTTGLLALGVPLDLLLRETDAAPIVA